METILGQMLAKYNAQTIDDKKNALKEIVQEVTLCGLSRAGFFKKVAFYGGTALRIFYGLDRFSEDLDFSLTTPDTSFELNPYFSTLANELESLGLHFDIEERIKTIESNVKSAFVKENTKEHILSVYNDTADISGINSNEVIKIKFEIDTNPPPFATYENKYRLLPSPYQVKLYDMSSLFAGKLHAVICRAWKNKIKGRDLYDYVFYLSQGTKVNLRHLEARLIQSGYIADGGEALTFDSLKKILIERFMSIDFEQAKQDVFPFVKDKSKLDIWSSEFFIAITNSTDFETTKC